MAHRFLPFRHSTSNRKMDSMVSKHQPTTKKRIVTYQELSTLVGRVNHVCFIILDARHFMSNLHWMESIARHKTKIKLSRRTLDNLDLWLEFLESSKYGIAVNRVIFRKPTITTFLYSSEFGIGGFCPQTGIGWRYHFIEEEQQAFILNTK